MTPDAIVNQLLGEADLSAYGDITLAADMRNWATGQSGNWLEWDCRMGDVAAVSLMFYPRVGYNLNTIEIKVVPRSTKKNSFDDGETLRMYSDLGYSEICTKLYELSGELKMLSAKYAKLHNGYRRNFLAEVIHFIKKDPSWKNIWKDRRGA